jgi:7tm Chemosensory receptor
VQVMKKCLRNLLKIKMKKIHSYKIILFAKILERCPYKFSCGLFDFDLKQAAVASGAALYYFLILIQFDIASKQSMQ